MTIGLKCKDGYVIGTNNKFVTNMRGKYAEYYAAYFDVFARECPLNHRELRKLFRQIGASEQGVTAVAWCMLRTCEART